MTIYSHTTLTRYTASKEKKRQNENEKKTESNVGELKSRLKRFFDERSKKKIIEILNTAKSRVEKKIKETVLNNIKKKMLFN